jgi:hypothetical protein
MTTYQITVIGCNVCNATDHHNDVTFEEYEPRTNYAGKHYAVCDECVGRGYFLQSFEAVVVAIGNENDLESEETEYPVG